MTITFLLQLKYLWFFLHASVYYYKICIAVSIWMIISKGDNTTLLFQNQKY